MLNHILFDLDETLYPKENGLMPAIGQRMSDYIVARFGVSAEEANALRKRYWQQYGTTLRGLYLEQQIDPVEYLMYVHDLPLAHYLKPDPRLRATLARIPQQKYIFTNSDVAHSQRILDALGIADQFTLIFDILFFQLESKPNLSPYRRVLDALNTQPERCAVVDDMPRNLEPARSLGMKTVLVGAVGDADACIETIYDVADAIQVVNGR